MLDENTITMVARDRPKEFAAAISHALPYAQQVADRWHLSHNLTEVLDKVITACWKHALAKLRAITAQATPIVEAPPPHITLSETIAIHCMMTVMLIAS